MYLEVKCTQIGAQHDLGLRPEPPGRAVIAAIDVIVVSTADAVLVASRSKAEDVKPLVEELKARNYPAAVEHRRIYRPWGYYQDVDLAARYRVKRIMVKPGSTLFCRFA